MPQSIQSRLTLLYVGILAVILGVFSASLYFSARQELQAELADRLSRQGRAFADFVIEQEGEVLRGVHPNVAEPVGDYLQASDARAVVLDAQRKTLYRSADVPETALAADDLRSEAPKIVPVGPSKRTFRFVSLRAVDPQGQEIGWIAYGLDEGPVHDRLRRLLLYFAVFVPVVLAVSSYVGHLFVKGAMAPVETLRAQAQRISRSSLSERVPLPEAKGELRELATTFNEMLERLEKSFEQLRTFTSNASHELKTPLAVLRTEIELALSRRGEPIDHPALLASIAEEVARMTRVVENMMLLAQLDARQAPLRKVPVDLSAVATAIAEDARIMGEARKVAVKASWIAPGVVVTGDEAAIRRVVMNLIENAIKYNREGGEVKLSVWAEEGSARIEVADDGPGIPPEHLPKLFERFHRVDKGSGKGTGLGLSICKALVAAHDGRIDVKSQVGVGTTFHVVLPRA
jgi:heavy metal sensor kinase